MLYLLLYDYDWRAPHSRSSFIYLSLFFWYFTDQFKGMRKYNVIFVVVDFWSFHFSFITYNFPQNNEWEKNKNVGILLFGWKRKEWMYLIQLRRIDLLLVVFSKFFFVVLYLVKAIFNNIFYFWWLVCIHVGYMFLNFNWNEIVWKLGKKLDNIW